MNLLVTIPYCANDVDLLKKNLVWMASLQKTYWPHSCMFVADSAVPHEEKQAVMAHGKALFRTAETIIVRVPEAKQKWPLAPNLMFASAARQIQEAFKLPWFWLEPDAIPVRPGWLNTIAAAYDRCPRRFMGSLVPSNGQPNVPDLYLNGVAVYPTDTFSALSPFLNGDKPWDIASASYVVPRAYHTGAIQHFWGRKDLAPTFREGANATDPENTLDLSIIKPETAVFHRCKDGSLIDILRRNVVKSKKGDDTPIEELE